MFIPLIWHNKRNCIYTLRLLHCKTFNLTTTKMATEVLLHIKENLDDETMRKLIDTLSEECGGSKPHFDTNKPHQMFISYDENKISLHDIPDIAMKHGVHIEVIG